MQVRGQMMLQLDAQTCLGLHLHLLHGNSCSSHPEAPKQCWPTCDYIKALLERHHQMIYSHLGLAVSHFSADRSLAFTEPFKYPSSSVTFVLYTVKSRLLQSAGKSTYLQCAK